MINYILSWASTIPVALLLGIGLAMDSFGISITHGCKDPDISFKRILIIATTFGVFQGLMPLIGWLIVYGLSSIKSFSYVFGQIVPPLAFIILAFLGSKMIYEFIHKKDESDFNSNKSFGALLIAQAFATSIDALSSGLAMNDYSPTEAGVSVVIICLVTFTLCVAGVYLGRTFGHKVGSKAQIIGGIILILVGSFIFIKGEIRMNAPYLIPESLQWLF